MWLTVFFAWALSRAGVRLSLRELARITLNPKVLLPFLVFGVYITAVVSVANQAGVWNTNLLKDTLLWFVVVGLALLVTFSKATEEGSFFRRTALGTVGLSALLGFYMNVVVFALPVELVLQPVVAFLVPMSTVAELKPAHRPVKVIIDVALGVVVVGLAVAVGLQLTQDWST